MMKKTWIILCAGLLALGLLAAAGCGGSKTSTSEEKTEVISLDEDVEQGIVGSYVDSSTGTTSSGGSIVFLKDGTFEGNAWGSEKKGKYKVEKTPEDRNTVVLTFDDSGAIETWGTGIAMGKVVAVTSPDGVQFDKVVK